MICRNCGKMVLPSKGHIENHKFYCDDCTVCENCGTAIFYEDSYETGDGKHICQECREDCYFCCDHCGDINHQDDLTYIEKEGIYVCNNCLDKHYYRCECCDKYFPLNYIYETYNGNYVCDNCSDYHYSRCDDCGYWVHCDEYYYHEGSGSTYCPECECHHNDGDIFDYHDYIDFYPLSKSEENTKEYFGFELEVSGNRECANAFLDKVPDVVLMNDGSIKGGGFEIVSQPMTRKYFKEVFRPQLEEGLKYLDRQGFKGHNKGGMHVHIAAESLTKPQLAQMSEILYGDENDRDIWLCISQRHQENMDSWSSMTNKDYSFEDIKSYEYDMPHISNSRYTALNRDSRTNTYEIRIFNSNTRIERVLKNMECVFALVDYAKQEENSLFKCNTRGFLDFIYQNNLVYPNLYAFLLERKVQEHYGIKFTEEELEAA